MRFVSCQDFSVMTPGYQSFASEFCNKRVYKNDIAVTGGIFNAVLSYGCWAASGDTTFANRDVDDGDFSNRIHERVGALNGDYLELSRLLEEEVGDSDYPDECPRILDLADPTDKIDTFRRLCGQADLDPDNYDLADLLNDTEFYLEELSEALSDKAVLLGDQIIELAPDDVHQWFVISEWLYRKLLDKGQIVGDMPYGYVWGQTGGWSAHHARFLHSPHHL